MSYIVLYLSYVGPIGSYIVLPGLVPGGFSYSLASKMGLALP